MTAGERDVFLDREARARLGMSVEEFERRFKSGQLDDSDPDVPLLAVLTGMGESDHQL